MPTKYQLTWNAKQRRWFKKYKGKQYSFPGTTKEESYQSALAQWQAKRGEIDKEKSEVVAPSPDRSLEGEYRRIIDRWISAVDESRIKAQEADHQEYIADLRDCILTLAHLQDLLDRGWESLPDPSAFDFDYWQEGFPPAYRRFLEEANGRSFEANPDKSVGGNAVRFLEAQRKRVARGDIVHGRYGVIRCGVSSFERFAGNTSPLLTITARTVAAYNTFLMDEVDLGKIKDRTAADRWQVMKQFLFWCEEHGVIDRVPRNISNHSRSLTIKKKQQEVTTLPIETVKQLLKHANDRAKLYILLMLNCGMYTVDISSLKHSEVNWVEGRIIRKRSKTQHYDGVPTVNYKLWPETFRLLKQLRSEHESLVLVNRAGEQLRREYFADNGKERRTDPVQSTLKRVCEAHNIDGVTIKKFRKTSASKLAEHEIYGRFVQYYLGHAPSTVAEQSYQKPPQELFDNAIEWLCRHLLP